MLKRNWLAGTTGATLAVFVWMAGWWAPEDAVQGPIQRVFYPHVASAWIAAVAFLVVFIASINYLRTRKLRWDAIASASASVGLLFTTVTLVLGMIWGHEVWGVYWSWDPRLTSVLVLWLMYVGYLAVRSYVDDSARRARFSAVVGIVAFLDVPIIYFSIRWWRTLHPQPVIGGEADSGLPVEMLYTLLVGLVAFSLLYALLLQRQLRGDNHADADNG